MKIGYIVLGGVVAVAAIIGVSYVGAYNTANKAEQRVVAAYDNNENILAQYGQQIAEAASVTELQRDDAIDLATASIEARYGEEGSQAAFQWLQEQNPELDTAVYVQLQRAIEAGRNRFEAGQKSLVDTKRSYRTNLGSFWTGTWMSVAGYPTIQVGYPIGTADDYPIISTDRASETFQKGKEDGPISLRDENG